MYYAPPEHGWNNLSTYVGFRALEMLRCGSLDFVAKLPLFWMTAKVGAHAERYGMLQSDTATNVSGISTRE